MRVLPFVRGAHAGMDGTYVVMEFAMQRDIVYLEHKRSSLFVDEPNNVAPFRAATDTLTATALGPADSLEFLISVAKDFNEG